MALLQQPNHRAGCQRRWTHETFHCYQCEKKTSFTVWRTPEYTRDGKTALSRNVQYSDGTFVDGSGSGSILDGTPGEDGIYTGYHWTKACCETCGTLNSNTSLRDYSFGKNVYWLYDCASEFTEELEEETSCDYVDSTYHLKTTIRYGNTADSCNMETAPSYTEAGQYTVYYEITYTYGGESMTENGAAYVWLYDKNADKSVDMPACYENGTENHTYQTVIIREADCENEGKALHICSVCNHTEVISTPQGQA